MKKEARGQRKERNHERKGEENGVKRRRCGKKQSGSDGKSEYAASSKTRRELQLRAREGGDIEGGARFQI